MHRTAEQRRAYRKRYHDRDLASARKWRAEHPEIVREHNRRSMEKRRAQYPKNREAIQDRIKKFRAAHPEKVQEYNRRAYLKHRKSMIERASKYAKAHPEVVAATQAKRRAIQMAAPLGDLSVILQWQKSIRAMKWVRCHWCGTKVGGRKVHFDHVVSLHGGGSHSIGNLCASCRECNEHKNARAIADWISGGQTFLSL